MDFDKQDPLHISFFMLLVNGTNLLNYTGNRRLMHSMFVKYSTEHGEELFRMNFHNKFALGLRVFLTEELITTAAHGHNSSFYGVNAGFLFHRSELTSFTFNYFYS